MSRPDLDEVARSLESDAAQRPEERDAILMEAVTAWREAGRPRRARGILDALVAEQGDLAPLARIERADLDIEEDDWFSARAELATLAREPALTRDHCLAAAELLVDRGAPGQARAWFGLAGIDADQADVDDEQPAADTSVDEQPVDEPPSDTTPATSTRGKGRRAKAGRAEAPVEDQPPTAEEASTGDGAATVDNEPTAEDPPRKKSRATGARARKARPEASAVDGQPAPAEPPTEARRTENGTATVVDTPTVDEQRVGEAASDNASVVRAEAMRTSTAVLRRPERLETRPRRPDSFDLRDGDHHRALARSWRGLREGGVSSIRMVPASDVPTTVAGRTGRRAADTDVATSFDRTVPAPPTIAAHPGRNAPCSCGSSAKYKKCCGRPELRP